MSGGFPLPNAATGFRLSITVCPDGLMPILKDSTSSPKRFRVFIGRGVTVKSTVDESLRTVIRSGLSLPAVTISEISSHFVTAFPSMATILSPALIPASIAAEPSWREPTSGVSTGSPTMLTPVKITRASRTLKTGPAATIRIRFQTDCFRKDLFASSSGSSSPGDSPSSFT